MQKTKDFMRILGITLAPALLLAGGVSLGTLTPLAPAHAATKQELTIGISQFPRNFNPNIESMLAKSYILAMARRPLTATPKPLIPVPRGSKADLTQ